MLIEIGVAVAAAGIAGYLIQRRKRARESIEAEPAVNLLAAPAEERAIDNLFPGDVILHQRDQFIVTRAIAYQDYKRRLRYYVCDGGETAFWIDLGGGGEIFIGQPITLETPTEQLDLDGALYRMSREGQASQEYDRQREHADVGVDDRRTAYWEYQGERNLRVWALGGAIQQGWKGRRIEKSDIELLPGSF